MIQQYGRATRGAVRHIVRSEKGVSEGRHRRALCGTMVMIVPLHLTIGDTCQNCMRHPEFNGYDETSGPYRNIAAPRVD